MQELDKTDPSHRLVAHNKRSSSPNKFTTKLSTFSCLFCVLSICKPKLITDGPGPMRGSENTENVLDDIEQENAADNFNDLYPSMASSSILPKDTASEGDGETTDRETANSDDGRPQRLRANNGRNGSGSDMLASSVSQNHLPTSRKQLLTGQGVRCPAVSDRTWKEVQQLCNIECGPNLVQRIENGARGIGALRSHSSPPSAMLTFVDGIQPLWSLEKSRNRENRSLLKMLLASLFSARQAPRAASVFVLERYSSIMAQVVLLSFLKQINSCLQPLSSSCDCFQRPEGR